jgi:hypothetical protein
MTVAKAKCWICGDVAATREHKVKKSDLERVHGRGDAFRNSDLMYLTSDGTKLELQGSNSKHVKYDFGLCGNCNNKRTQPYDRAYDRFIEYVDSNSAVILSRRQFNFKEIFGDTWREDQEKLFLYFGKAFGCRIADANGEVPQDFSRLFERKYPEHPLVFCFSVDEDECDKPLSQASRLGVAALIHSEGSSGPGRFAAAARYRWLLISYWYNWGPFGPMGEPWIRSQQFVCLGSYRQGEDKVTELLDDGSEFQWPGIEHFN